MMLNLEIHSAELQEKIVIHEFGHALGLEHEYKRSDFWDVVEKHINMDMKSGLSAANDISVNSKYEVHEGKSFGKDWLKARAKGLQLYEYDPDSIMQHW